jgi:hypothetical protein
MKKIFPILLAITLVSMASKCKDTPEPACCVTPPKPGTLDMNFKAMYANKPLVINQVNDYNGKKIIFERLQFFIAYDPSNIEGVVGDNPPKATLVKLTGLTDTASANAGVSVDIPMSSRTSSSINFGIGIPKTLNAILPKDFTFPDGMADSGNFWDGWQSYIFAKLEGKIDKDGDGVFETGITLHTGGNEVFTQLKFAKTFTIKDATTTKINFELNINELVKNIDLATVNSTHQIGSTAVMKVMMGNFPTALTAK